MPGCRQRGINKAVEAKPSAQQARSCQQGQADAANECRGASGRLFGAGPAQEGAVFDPGRADLLAAQAAQAMVQV